MTADEVRALVQAGYYDAIDRGDMDAAAEALADDVDWSHAQVWAHHGFARGEPMAITGRDAVRAFLAERVGQLREARITHHVDRMIFDGEAGAFLGHVAGPHGERRPFMAWIEVRGGLIARYSIRPL